MINNRGTVQKAIELYQAGEFRQAESLCRDILAEQPDNADILHLSGVLSYQSGRYDSAIEYLNRALRLIPANAHVHYNLGNAYKNKGESDKAISYYRKALQLNPNFFEACHNLGTVLQDKRLFDEAIPYYRRALELNPALADAYYNLGTISQDRRRLDEAITFYQKAVQTDPNFTDAYYNLGNTFLETRQFDEAALNYQKALRLKPDLAAAYYGLGSISEEEGRLSEAADFYQKALQFDPNFADAYNSLGNVLLKQDSFEKALGYYHRALVVKPDFVEALVNLGNMLRDFGQPVEAEKCYRRSLAIRPDCSFCYENLLFLMHYNPRYDAQTIFAEHLKFAAQFEAPLRAAVLPHANTKNAERRLKIGYVSPDFRRHPVASFIEPILAAHNRTNCEVFCYSDVPKQDEITARMKGYSDHWRDIPGMPEKEAAELVRKDGIDILVDLAGHTAHNRLLLFARKPAPVQVSWLGYPATTGLSSMDYKIVDGHTDPFGMTERFYTEELLRLPGNFLCFLPDNHSPGVGMLPALESGHITFGSCNNFAKISPGVIDLWTTILKSVPGSRMIMKAKSLSDGSTREYVMDMFRQKGVSPQRIELLSWEPSAEGHLNTYNRMDIALDTFPYNGTTTTCEAIWMGVPVITVAGTTHASRVGASLLTTVGIPECIASTPEEYLAKAVGMAADIQRLQLLRGTLRGMMAHSALVDAQRFVVSLEAAYRAIWVKWCGGI